MSVTYKTFDELRNEVIALGKERQRLKKREEESIAELQKRCTHTAVIETPNSRSPFSPVFLERRLCVLCGLEEGWKIGGYKTLGNCNPIQIIEKREEFYLFRTLQPLKTITVPEGLFENKE